MELVARQMAHYLLSRGSDAHQPFSRKWRSDASAGCRHCSRPARRGGYIFPASGPAESRFIPALEDRVTAEATVHERGTTKVFQKQRPQRGGSWGHYSSDAMGAFASGRAEPTRSRDIRSRMRGRRVQGFSLTDHHSSSFEDDAEGV